MAYPTIVLGNVKILKIVECQMSFQPSRFFKSEIQVAKERASGNLGKVGPPSDSYIQSEEANAIDEKVRGVDWLRPHYLNEDGDVVLAVQMLVIETDQGTRIAVDTCIGDHKSLPGSEFHDKQSSFMQDLEAAGCSPDSIDYVLCTHLHFDHVGFNTVLRDGKWVPTFPNAKYLFAKKEWNAYQEEMIEGQKDFIGNATIYKESVQPVIDAGLCELVDSDHVLVDDDSCRVSLLATNGHTAGHVSVVVESQGKTGVITGDCIHHPVQLAYPEMGTFYDTNSVGAARTRRVLFQNMFQRNILLLGTHFPVHTVGHLEQEKPNSRKAYRFCPYVQIECGSCQSRKTDITADEPAKKASRTMVATTAAGA
eukprot:TRINITY_DN49818_c0_g1_i1.p1 TRINITY_DN49818_c0_g1~~TRINITY_DN49818_c0_g1_i1.p1  ORF type:complete len:387 (+),score=40.55 TRINITY_DN49818_c0_g1_i1:63-1163(+)